MSEIKFISTDFIKNTEWDGFGWFGEVLMAKKTDMQKQIVIRASSTGCVTDGKNDLNIRLEKSSFPEIQA